MRRFKRLTNREWEMYNKCFCGYVKHSKSKRLIFLTLTTSWSAVQNIEELGINKSGDWRLRAKFMYNNFRLLKLRYEREFKKKFGEYFRVFTCEGNGVLHIVYAGDYISRNWIVENWNEIHGSQIVDIRYPRGDSVKGSMYVISQYVAGQEGKKIFGYSRNWIYGGFATRDYKVLKDGCRLYDKPIVNVYNILFYPLDYGFFRFVLKYYMEWMNAYPELSFDDFLSFNKDDLGLYVQEVF